MCDIVVKKFTFAISSPDEFLSALFTDDLDASDDDLGGFEPAK